MHEFGVFAHLTWIWGKQDGREGCYDRDAVGGKDGRIPAIAAPRLPRNDPHVRLCAYIPRALVFEHQSLHALVSDLALHVCCDAPLAALGRPAKGRPRAILLLRTDVFLGLVNVCFRARDFRHTRSLRIFNNKPQSFIKQTQPCVRESALAGIGGMGAVRT